VPGLKAYTDLPSQVPRVIFYVTDARAWPSIEAQGLLTAAALVREWEVPPEEATELLAVPRRKAVDLDHPDRGHAWLRDQGRMTGAALSRVLEEGWSVADWCRLLNGLVFFFPTERAALDMAGAYSDRPQVLLRLSTSSLATSYGTLLKVATTNTGSTSRGAAHKMRGRSTFVPALRYVGTASALREIVVADDIRDLSQHLLSHQRLTD